MKTSKIILALIIVQTLCLFIPQTVFCQTETLDIIKYTPPKGWTKTSKEGVMVYTDSNKTTGGFCILTVYPSTVSAGSPQKDFDSEWNELVVKTFKGEATPKTETQTEDGWTSVSAATEIESDGVKSAVLMTVVSGYGRAASIFVILNDKVYFPQIDAFMTGIKMDKAKAIATKNPTPSPKSATASEKSEEYLDFDPFPDKEYVQPQKPLIGRLRKTITLADLAGTWEIGGASVTTYFNSGNYSSTDTSFFRKKYTILADGTYESKFQGRTSNTTIRETDSGTIILSGGTITMKSNKNPAMKYQFVAFMSQSDGSAVLSLIYIGDNAQLNGTELKANCGHANGFVSCGNDEEWLRIPK
jgi:hypothetical protein